MDGDLKKAQSEGTFSMKVMLYKNSDLLEDLRLELTEDAKKEAEKRTKSLLEIKLAALTAVESDNELDDMYAAYATPSDRSTTSEK